jgi:hypothetical protein
LNVHFVSDAKLQPDQLTIFNHPSNVVSLGIQRGSGYYHAEIETVRAVQQQQAAQQADDPALHSSKSDSSSSSSAAAQIGNVLKIRFEKIN